MFELNHAKASSKSESLNSRLGCGLSTLRDITLVRSDQCNVAFEICTLPLLIVAST